MEYKKYEICWDRDYGIEAETGQRHDTISNGLDQDKTDVLMFQNNHKKMINTQILSFVWTLEGRG